MSRIEEEVVKLVYLERCPSQDASKARVAQKIRSRSELGLKKYGQTLERTDFTRLQWLVHAQEEAMDLAGYATKLIEVGAAGDPHGTMMNLLRATAVRDIMVLQFMIEMEEKHENSLNSRVPV